MSKKVFPECRASKTQKLCAGEHVSLCAGVMYKSTCRSALKAMCRGSHKSMCRRPLKSIHRGAGGAQRDTEGVQRVGCP